MDRKDELVERIQFELCGGDLTADMMERYHPAIITPIIGDVMDMMLRNAYRQSSAAKGYKDSFMLDPISKTYPNDDYPSVPVLYDSIRKEHYAVLPVRIVDLMDNDGIRVVCDIEDQTNQYAPIPNNSEMYYSETNSGPSAFHTYKLEGMKLFFKFKNIPKSGIMVRVVPSFSELSDSDIVCNPEILTKGGVVGVADEVRRRMLTMPQTKSAEDNTTKHV